MNSEVLVAGFGGQGVLLIGRLIAYAGMMEDKEVSWIPAYGPEMRGGTASCSVIVSDEEIGSPIVTAPNVFFAMNKPSLDKFLPAVEPGGVVLINSSLIERTAERSDVKTYYVPLNELAIEDGGKPRDANMVALGALVGATDVVSLDSIGRTFKKTFADKPQFIESNLKAVIRGINCVVGQK